MKTKSPSLSLLCLAILTDNGAWQTDGPAVEAFTQRPHVDDLLMQGCKWDVWYRDETETSESRDWDDTETSELRDRDVGVLVSRWDRDETFKTTSRDVRSRRWSCDCTTSTVGHNVYAYNYIGTLVNLYPCCHNILHEECVGWGLFLGNLTELSRDESLSHSTSFP